MGVASRPGKKEGWDSGVLHRVSLTKRLDNKGRYPLPRVEDTLYRLSHARNVSSIDLRSGYRNIEVDERDHKKTTLVTSDVLYEHEVMPFEHCAASATFQRVMDTASKSENGRAALSN